MISGRTALYGVLGHPVGHSRSPAMHNSAFAALGLDAAYVALPVPPDRLAEGIAGAHALGFRGLNVTVPHKQAAAALCRRLDATAEACGAVNTLRRAERGWDGFNTDAPALRALLEAAGVGRGRRALLIGAGGAALAGAWALLAIGADLTVTARRQAAAEDVCRRMRAAFPATAAPRSAPWGELAACSAAAGVIVNATSAGLGGGPGGAEGPVLSAVEGQGLPPLAWRPGQVAVDFVYGDTAFARAARAGGAALLTGEAILVRQGALAFTLWTGQPAPEAVMSAALREPGHDP